MVPDNGALAHEAGIRVLILDDHRLYAEAVRIAIGSMEMMVVGTVSNTENGLALALDLVPDLVLVDVGLPDGSGLAIGTAILAEIPGTKVVVMAPREDERWIRETLHRGFHGYMTKGAEPGQLRRTVARVLEGEMVFPRVRGRDAPQRGERSSSELMARHLTPREREVLQLLAEGASSHLIAERLSVSPHTVRTHVAGILTKLQAHSRFEAVAYAIRHALVTVRS